MGGRTDRRVAISNSITAGSSGNSGGNGMGSVKNIGNNISNGNRLNWTYEQAAASLFTQQGLATSLNLPQLNSSSKTASSAATKRTQSSTAGAFSNGLLSKPQSSSFTALCGQWRRYMSETEFALASAAFAAGPDVWSAFLSITSGPDSRRLIHQLVRRSVGGDKQSVRMDLDEGDQNIDGVVLDIFILASFRTRIMLAEQQYFNETSQSPSSPDSFIDDMYYSLEYDLECYNYWRDIRGNIDMLVSRPASNRTALGGAAVGSVKHIAGLGSVKHLFYAIDDYAKRSNVSAGRLKALLLEIRPKSTTSSSKWANDDRVGQSKLYDAMDKVLDTLRNYKEHSFPFLAKVSRREAPDYYDVIKNPMDLGTMSKKMKAFQYNCKDDFATDLQLIWDNCFYYNSDPSSVYRIHASAMQQKTAELMRNIPNIRIKTRQEAEADGAETGGLTGEEAGGEGLSDDNDDDGDDASSASSSSSAGEDEGTVEDDNESFAPPSLAGDSAESEMQQTQTASSPIEAHQPTRLDDESMEEEHDGQLDGLFVVAKDAAETKEEMIKISLPEGLFEFPKTTIRTSMDEEEPIPAAELTGDEGETIRDRLEDLAADPSVTNYIRTMWESKAESMHRTFVRRPFSNFDALMRTSADMESFFLQCQLYWKRKHHGGPANNKNFKFNDEVSSDYFFFPESFCLMGGLPDLAIPLWPPVKHVQSHELFMPDYLEIALQRQPSVSESKVAFPDIQALSMFKSCIDLYRRTRALNRQLNDVIRQYQSGNIPATFDADGSLQVDKAALISAISAATGEESEFELGGAKNEIIPSKSTAADGPLRVPVFSESCSEQSSAAQLNINEELADNLLQRALAIILLHGGFDSANSEALSVIKELAKRRLQTIGRIFKLYCDSYGGSIPLDSIVQKTMQMSGIESYGVLEALAGTDLLRRRNKLLKLHNRLESYYNVLIEPVASEDMEQQQQQQQQREGEEDFEDNDIAFVMGDFAATDVDGGLVGDDDYLGLKSLGVGVLGRVPERLWNVGKEQSKLNQKRRKSAVAKTWRNSLLAKAVVMKQVIDHSTPPPFTPIQNVEQVIGLLKPFFAKKLSESQAGFLVEDEYLPPKPKKKKRYPKKPKPKKITTNATTAAVSNLDKAISEGSPGGNVPSNSADHAVPMITDSPGHSDATAESTATVTKRKLGRPKVNK